MTTISVACFADSHFSARVGGRLSECNRTHLWAAEDCGKRGVSLIAHAGDVFHAQSRPDERLAVRAWIEALPAPLLAVAGNHDSPRDLVGLEPYGWRRAVHVVEQPEVVSIAGLQVACLPDLRRDALVGAIVARGEQPTGDAVAEEARAIIAKLGADLAIAPQGRRMMLAHGMIKGSLKGGDQPRTHGDDLLFTAADFACVPADVFVFGHVHRGQRLPGFGAYAFYVGTQYATTYAELEPKRYVLLHFNGGQVEVEPVPIPSTPLRLLVGTWTGADLALAYGPEHDAGDKMPHVDELRGADVRLRYVVPSTDETAIEGAANAARAELLAAGAVNVKLDPIRQRVVKTRAPAYKQATTLVDRLDAYWSACGGIDSAKRERVIALLPELANDVPNVSGGLVRVESMMVRGLGRLVGESTLDFADWSGVVALTGENGEGKSTLVGLLPALLAGESPTHGALVDLAKTDDACLEGVVETCAGKWRICHEPKRGLSTVYGANGQPICSGGRNTYRAWAKQWLPDSRALGSYFTLKSRSMGLAALYDASLQEVMLRALGSYHLDAWAAAARKRANVLENEVRELDGALVGAPFDASAEAEAHEAAEQSLTVARKALDKTRVDRDAWVAWSMRQKAHEDVKARAEQLRRRVGTARQEIGDATLVRAAVNDLATAREQATASLTAMQQAEHSARLCSTIMHQFDGEQRRLQSELATAKRRIVTTERDLAERNAIEAAVARLPQRREDVANARTMVDQTTAELDAIVALQHAGLRGRVQGLRGHVRTIHDMTRNEDDADTTLLAVQSQCNQAERHDDAAVNDDNDAIRAARNAKKTVEQRLAKALADESVDEKLAARIDVIRRAEQTWTDAMAERERLTQLLDECTLQLAAKRDEYANTTCVHNEAKATHERDKADARRLESIAARLPTIERAEATLATIEADLAQVVDSANKLARDVGDEPERVTQRDVDQAEQRLAQATSALGMATARLERARADVQRAIERRERRARLAEQCDDLTTLEVALGRHGVQAIEVEHEGEVIAAETTERMQDVLGSRWSVTFDALRPDAGTGKRMIEQARWMSHDATMGNSCEIRARSDGEQALHGTAMFLAMASAMARRWGQLQGATMAFDETAVSLRGANVDAWVEMVRCGMSDLQVGTLLLVPPDAPQVTDMSDVRLIVGGGVIALAGT